MLKLWGGSGLSRCCPWCWQLCLCMRAAAVLRVPVVSAVVGFCALACCVCCCCCWRWWWWWSWSRNWSYEKWMRFLAQNTCDQHVRHERLEQFIHINIGGLLTCDGEGDSNAQMGTGGGVIPIAYGGFQPEFSQWCSPLMWALNLQSEVAAECDQSWGSLHNMSPTFLDRPLITTPVLCLQSLVFLHSQNQIWGLCVI